MTPLKSAKDKGSGFERDLVKLLNEKIKYGSFKKIPGSGAMGTALHETTLTGDVAGKVLGIPRALKIECKVGYGGETQLTLKREWLNKIIEEAEQAYGFPVMVGKFSGARKTDGVQIFAVLDIDHFIYLMNLISDLQRELDLIYEEKDG